MKIDCPHIDAALTGQVCPHLPVADLIDYKRLFTGTGQAYELLCETCAGSNEGFASKTLTICNQCFDLLEEEHCWVGISGQPEIRRESSSLKFEHTTVSIEGLSHNSLLDIRPMESSAGIWIGLTQAGELLKIDFPAKRFSVVAQINKSDFDFLKPLSITVSPSGNFVALTETLGQRGTVIDLFTGMAAMQLRRDDYHCDVSPFPLAFFVSNEKELIVHATQWNRLDISDPATGKLLTDRSQSVPIDPKALPDRYLNYFHGRLHVSPNHSRIADDGWVWAPAGIPMTWSLQAWIETNPWESEDGESKKRLCQRWYYWGGPICWVDENTIAIWGYGDDDEWLIPAVRLFDANSGHELSWFAGPQIAPNDGVSWKDKLIKHGELIFDKYLFACSQKFGISVWDVWRGTCLFEDPSFCPVRYHSKSKEFLSLMPDNTFMLLQLING